MAGYAVVDVETTGLFPGGRDRVVEIAVVQVAPDGVVEETWSTLVNPGRDLGPQHIHGIRAADVRHAPSFADVADHVARLLEGRAFVAHNAQFDRRFVWHEFARQGVDVPLIEPTSLCTMRTGQLLSPDAPRSLGGSCRHHGVELRDAHEAMSDARAAAGLLQVFLDRGSRRVVPGWDDVVELAETTPWPEVAGGSAPPVGRGVSELRDAHFLARLRAAGDRPIGARAKERYLELVDRALLDRHISAREHDQLAVHCAEAGIGRAEADALHREYLASLAGTAWADGVLAPEARTDFREVAAMLQVPDDDAERLLAAPPGTTVTRRGTTGAGRAAAAAVSGATDVRPAAATAVSGATANTGRAATANARGGATAPERGAATTNVGAAGYATRRPYLAPGDRVVFTGAMREPRDVWEGRARAAGLVPHPTVTKAVRLVVAADPDSFSAKARKAEAYGITVVSEAGFEHLIQTLAR
ncbi:exonuclease domain-containing protein [Myceligenerans indicum]|uniref:DNA polymerase III subunit epsilon n=1 Tax=Myceligenerans indicum TaxID=2593663 RepID=A0ABS1LQ52_9MICO|nr:exonuclease domain-containing protein [Myceligenerans indicum]MBL0888129.1 DNA polymerase III subunit epsilon [Myceligenerans indicum]